MTMRKKDYEAIARAIGERRTAAPHYLAGYESVQAAYRHALWQVSQDIADYCATQDPTFKRDRFLADCGVSHG